MTAISSGIALEPKKTPSPIYLCSRWVLVIALVVVAVCFLIYLLLALPAYDDYGRSTQPQILGYWAYFFRLYTHWQGRWVSFGLESAVLPLTDMTRTYPALIGAVAVADFAGIYCICRCLTRLGSRWFSLACAIGLAAVLWAQMPSVAQAVYWFVGTVENTLVLALAGMLLAGMISMRATGPWMVFASMAAIVICGFHEAYGAMLCIALATGTLAAHWIKSDNRTAWLVVLTAALVGFAIVAGAPGNRHRMRADGNIHSAHFEYDLRLAASQFLHWSRHWLLDPKLLGASLWVACSPTLEASRPVWPKARKIPFRLLLPIAWLCMLGVGFFAPSWAFGNPMPPRTLSGNFMVFAVGWLLIVLVWTRRLDARDQPSPNCPQCPGAATVARLVLALGLLLTGNTRDAMRDLATGRVLKWRSSVEDRFALLRRSGDTDLVLPRQAPPSRLLYEGEITTDPAYWENTGMAEYFHVKSIRVRPIATTTPSGANEQMPETESKSPNM